MPKTKRTNAQWARDPRVQQARLVAVQQLRGQEYSYKEIAAALHITPDYARRCEAKAGRKITTPNP